MAVSQIIGASIADGAIAAIDITDGTITTAKLAATTGSGNVVLSAAPTLTGNTSLVNLTVSGTQTNSTLTSGRVHYSTTGGLLTDSSNLQFDGTNLGIGVTPASWLSTWKALQVSNRTSLAEIAGITFLGNNFYQNTSSQNIYLQTGYATLYSQNSGQHNWQIAPSGTAGDIATLTQAMTLDASGYLGIGTTAPSSYGGLAVRKAVTVSSVPVSASFSDSSNSTFDIRHSANIVNLSAQGSGITIDTGNSTRMTITDAGLVGIGTTSPADALNIGNGKKFRATHSANVYQQIFSSASGNFLNAYGDNFELNADSGAIYLTVTAAQPMVFQTTNTERMRISAAGLVGIGTISPDAQLDVTRSGHGQIAVLQTSANRGFSFESQSDTALQISSVQASTNMDLWANTLSFSAGGSERMRITSTGLVGIGTTTPNAKLSINTTTFTSVADTAQVAIENTEAWSQGLAFHIWGSGTYNSGYASGYIGSPNTSGRLFMSGGARVIDNPDGGGNWAKSLNITAASFINVGESGILFSSNSGLTVNTAYTPTLRMKIGTDGNIGIGGNLCIGAASGNYQLHVTTSFAVGLTGFNQQLSFTNDTIQSLLLGTGYTSLKLNPLGGNVGIGTSSPSGKLQIDSANVDPSATATGITLINSTSSQATNNGGSISLGGVYTGSSITQFGYILGAKENSTDGNYAGYLSFGTRPNGNVSQERMRIDSSGNVGIGTSSPAARLDVTTSTAGFAAILTNTNGASDSNGLNIRAGTVSTEYNLRLSNASNTVDFMVVKGNGNVGIGTSSPAFLTEIVGGATTVETTLFQVRSNAGGIGTGTTIALGNSTNAAAGSGRVELAGIRDTASGSSFVIRTADSSGTIQNRVKINESGNVGIGTSSPAYKLVAIDTGNAKQQITFSDNASYFGSISHNSGTGQNEYRTEASGGHGWFIGTSSTTANMTLDSSGNLLVGTTSVSATLEKVSIQSNSAPNLILRSTGNPSMRFYNSSDNAVNSCQLNYTSGTSFSIETIPALPITFLTTNTERMRISAEGSVSITQAPGKYTIDVTGGATSIAAAGVVDFPSASGMLIVNNWTDGQVTIYLCGGGSTGVVANVAGTQVGSFAYNAGIAGYRWTNTYGSTAIFGFFFVRTRSTA